MGKNVLLKSIFFRINGGRILQNRQIDVVDVSLEGEAMELP